MWAPGPGPACFRALLVLLLLIKIRLSNYAHNEREIVSRDSGPQINAGMLTIHSLGTYHLGYTTKKRGWVHCDQGAYGRECVHALTG
jgi:hypothetical protein